MFYANILFLFFKKQSNLCYHLIMKTLKISYIFLILPLILGIIGLTEAQIPMSDALFYSFSMYFVAYEGPAYNYYVEAARWLAPIMTFSSVLMFFSYYRQRIYNYIKYQRNDSVVLYGNAELCSIIKQSLNNPIIETEDFEFVKAHRYILCGAEEENLLFYENHKEKLRDKKVYIQCETLRSQLISNDNVKLFNMNEISARLYWNKFDIKKILANIKDAHIVLIGFENLGKEIILQALQNNIFDPGQHITYDVFGEEEHFTSIYSSLANISDTVVFYDRWESHLDLINKADVVIVCEQNNQLSIIQTLLMQTTINEIEVFADNPSIYDLLSEQNRLNIFDFKQLALTKENIFNERTLDVAKRLNLRYAHLYNNVEENEVNKELEWNKLDTFTKYSNISSTDYHVTRLKLIQDWDLNNLTDERIDYLAHLEHIRWSRYHYLSNWKYGIPANGKNKDSKQKIHIDLIPYEKLSKVEKDKDRDTVKLLLEFK